MSSKTASITRSALGDVGQPVGRRDPGQGRVASRRIELALGHGLARGCPRSARARQRPGPGPARTASPACRSRRGPGQSRGPSSPAPATNTRSMLIDPCARPVSSSDESRPSSSSAAVYGSIRGPPRSRTAASRAAAAPGSSRSRPEPVGQRTADLGIGPGQPGRAVIGQGTLAAPPVDRRQQLGHAGAGGSRRDQDRRAVDAPPAAAEHRPQLAGGALGARAGRPC